MTRSSLHYWLFIFAILARLVLGEFAHAMPQPAEPTSQECADHAPADTGGDDVSDCCKGAQCECACIHATAFEGSYTKSIIGASYVPSHPSLASTQKRPNTLFRPPA